MNLTEMTYFDAYCVLKKRRAKLRAKKKKGAGVRLEILALDEAIGTMHEMSGSFAPEDRIVDANPEGDKLPDRTAYIAGLIKSVAKGDKDARDELHELLMRRA